MPQKTNISYADLSSNPIKAVNTQTGKRYHFCTKIQAGCAHCYSETLNLKWGNGLEYTVQNEKFVKFVIDDKELDALAKVKEPSRIFLFDMTDIFHHLITDEQRDTIFEGLDTLTQHTLLILTKRPWEMVRYFEYRYGDATVPFHCGTSISTQKDADENISHLLKVKAKVRFISAEPLLERIKLIQDGAMLLHVMNDRKSKLILNRFSENSGIDWVIIGGESGKDHRPMKVSWMSFLYEQCKEAGVPVFIKQGSAFKPGQQGKIPDWLWGIKQFPEVEG